MTLREIVSDDSWWIAAAVGAWEPTQRWSLGGFDVTPQLLHDLLGGGVVLQRAIWLDDTPAAIVQVSDVNRSSGYATLSLIVDPSHVAELRSPVNRFVDMAFHELNLRKLCVANYEDEVDLPDLLGTRAEQAGCLKDHCRRAENRYVDRLVYEIWRGA